MDDFETHLIRNLPRLRRYARSLLQDPQLADDLVQGCLERAWSRKRLWKAREDMCPWLFTIMHNIHANNARRYSRRPQLVSLEVVSDQGETPNQFSSVVLHDLKR